MFRSANDTNISWKAEPVGGKPDSEAASAKNKEDKENKIDTIKILTKGKLAKLPSKFSPMLATMVDKPFDKEGWQYEVKWDGYRAVALCNKTKNGILKSMDVTSYQKTSGSTGIHIYIPLGANYTYEQSKEYARVIATLVQRGKRMGQRKQRLEVA